MSSRSDSGPVASCSAEPLETDWRLFTTLIRFDAVYQIHFKCSLRKVAEIRTCGRTCATCTSGRGSPPPSHSTEIRDHYHRTHPMINPSGLVAAMPDLAFDAPPGREHL